MKLAKILARLRVRPKATEVNPVIEPAPAELEAPTSSADEMFARLAEVDYDRPRRRPSSS